MLFRSRNLASADAKRVEEEHKMVVASALRIGGGKVSAEPPPHLGSVSDQELRNYTKADYGF